MAIYAQSFENPIYNISSLNNPILQDHPIPQKLMDYLEEPGKLFLKRSGFLANFEPPYHLAWLSNHILYKNVIAEAYFCQSQDWHHGSKQGAMRS